MLTALATSLVACGSDDGGSAQPSDATVAARCARSVGDADAPLVEGADLSQWNAADRRWSCGT